MRTSGFLILTFTVIMVISSLAHATLAICPTCKGAQPDWVASAKDFLEGKPANSTPTGLNGPQQARLLDAQIDSKKNPSQVSNVSNNAAATPMQNSTPMLGIVLNDIRAAPNPANFGDIVKMTAVLGNVSSNTQIVATPNNLSGRADLAEMLVVPTSKTQLG